MTILGRYALKDKQNHSKMPFKCPMFINTFLPNFHILYPWKHFGNTDQKWVTIYKVRETLLLLNINREWNQTVLSTSHLKTTSCAFLLGSRIKLIFQWKEKLLIFSTSVFKVGLSLSPQKLFYYLNESLLKSRKMLISS